MASKRRLQSNFIFKSLKISLLRANKEYYRDETPTACLSTRVGTALACYDKDDAHALVCLTVDTPDPEKVMEVVRKKL